MTDQIVSPAQMRARGRAAFQAGRGRDEHNMNHGAPAVDDFQQGWDGAQADQAAEEATA